MQYFKFICLLVFLALLSACNSTPPHNPSYSDAANLMLKTKIARDSELTGLLDAHKKLRAKNISSAKNNQLSPLTKGILFNQGTLKSVEFMARTGITTNPFSLFNTADWTMLGLGLLINTDMKHHPFTYTYFYHVDANCTDIDCVDSSFKSFGIDLAKQYTDYLQKNPTDKFVVTDIETVTSNWIAKYFDLKIRHKYSDTTKRDSLLSVMTASNLGEIKGTNNLIWGNTKPRKRPDHLGFFKADYIEQSEMLINASKSNPNMLIFRGISRTRIEQNKPCYGGYFIQNGEVMVVPELQCMESLSDTVFKL